MTRTLQIRHFTENATPESYGQKRRVSNARTVSERSDTWYLAIDEAASTMSGRIRPRKAFSASENEFGGQGCDQRKPGAFCHGKRTG